MASFLIANTSTFASITDGGTRAFSADLGTGANRVAWALVIWFRNTNRMMDVSSLTYNGVAMTPLGAAVEVGTSEMFVRLYRLVAPATGTNNFVLTPTWGGGGSSTDCNLLWYVAQDTDQTTPESDYTVNQGTATGVPTTSLSLPSAVDDLAIAFQFNASSDVSYSAAASSTLTLRSNSTGVGAYGLGWNVGDMAGASPTVAPSVNWTTGMGGAATNEWIAIGISANPVAAAAPTITSHPANAVSRVNGDASAAVSFTVTATGTGELSYQWEEDAGSGFAPISNGGIYAGATTAALTVTPTSTAPNGNDYRCAVDDDNGTTNSNSALLTVLSGPTRSATSDTTDGTGAASITSTTDDALTGNGEVLLWRARVGGVLVATTTTRPS